MININQAVGTDIRKWRHSQIISINDLSYMLDISDSFLGLAERGQRGLGLPKIILFKKMSALLYDEIFNIDDTYSADDFDNNYKTLIQVVRELDGPAILLIRKFVLIVGQSHQNEHYHAFLDALIKLTAVLYNFYHAEP